MVASEIQEISPADKQVSAAKYNAMVRAVRVLLTTQYTSDFTVCDTGISRMISLVRSASTYKRSFDLADTLTTTFSIMDNQGRVNFYLRGAKTTIGNGTAMTWNGTDRWTSGTVSAAGYVYLEVDRPTVTVTINFAAALPAGGDDKEIYPLWYIAFDSTIISWTNTIDMRDMPRLSGMG